jgi:hypothetical protein
MLAQPLAFTIEQTIDLLLKFTSVALLLWAFIDCVTRRPDAFPAVGTLPKAGWLLILGLIAFLAAIFAPGGLISMIAFGAALIYLLDVRRALRDATQGPW